MPINRPTAAELVDSVSEFLDGELAGATPQPNLAFKQRIARNVLRIVSRELRQGAALTADESRLCRHWLDVDEEDPLALNAALCAQIRDGRFDDRLPDLLADLKPLVESKLAIDNPRHLADGH